MTKRAVHRPSAALGTGKPDSVRGRRRKTGHGQPWRILPGSLYGYAAAGLAVIALGITWSFGVVGCAPVTSSGRMNETPCAFFANVRQSPGEVSRLMRNAHYYKLMGRPELALKELEQAHQQNPDNLQIVNTLAQGYEELGQFETARKIYQEALVKQAPHPALANNLCFTYYLEGRWQEAETCYRQTLARDPGNEAARNNLGLLYCRLGHQDEARQLWQEAEGQAAAAYKTRQALSALGMPDRAVYALTPEPAPPLREGSTPTPVAASSQQPPTLTGKLHTPVEPRAPQKVAMRLVPKPAPEKPVLKDVKPVDEAQPQPASVKASMASSPAPAPRINPRPRPGPLTCAELVDTAIEVRNGTPALHLARQMRSLLNREGFSVASIGNHVDFGATKTIIYYRSQAQRVAQALQTEMLPMACLEQTSSLNDALAIKVLLGHDLLENQDLMTRLGEDEAHSPVVAKAPPQTPKLLTAPAAAKQQAKQSQTVSQENAVQHQRQSQFSAPRAQAPAPRARAPLAPLTCAELVDTAIEVRNGTHAPLLARQTRTLLNLKGFTVAKIGNHIDFGAEKTTIYYRPEAERVARALSSTLFPGAGLEPDMKLPHDITVKILLGADLLERPQLMARLAAERE
jgi:Tfp pilus assembly protein PilF